MKTLTNPPGRRLTGAPAIPTTPLTVRLPDALRDRLKDAVLPPDTLTGFIIRVLDSSLPNLNPPEK